MRKKAKIYEDGVKIDTIDFDDCEDLAKKFKKKYG